MTERRATTRLDKWLWHARFFRTRSLATQMVAAGKVRVNAARTTRPAHPVGPGDTLTFARGGQVLVVRVLAIAERRGPASAAQTLYQELQPPGAGA